MVQFTSLIHEIMPAWLRRRSRRRMQDTETTFDPSRPEDADAVWRKAVERDLFGANTPDYTETEQKKRDHH
ncbi:MULTISPECIES: hypothetical protein [unclassified Mesorhizobium]|uniref:hypothetical protein n=1 Tax=unclassified Mesorhizobium TaxID=325217 RepID=UPI00112A1DAD|nr:MULTISPECIES: hypothetical protein [unclassified Mesorhizobium]MBZ9810614.1 hypothetical protein [Mesorhizobium sp. ESP-6-2]TPM34007.1 hypothetical protein FJ955_04545 [Mesorhizobium sp. B2-2-2]TPN66479.1 hypothetical protein FJ986_13835 [Mesorhizobium sp. B1-1-1]